MQPDEAQFLIDFENCTLDPDLWTHTAHVRMTWLCLRQASYPEALERIRAGIMRYNGEVLDKLPEYHETVTVAFARLIASRICPGEDWETFAARNDDLFTRTPPALSAYYSMTRLMSEEARKNFVEPDLRALPELQ